VEHGVRFVQCSHSYKWDQHSDVKARQVECPQGGPQSVRFHDLVTGGGAKGGIAQGATDEFGYYAVEK
jgi:hypothetical protein